MENPKNVPENENTPVTIRPALPADAAQVAGLCDQLGYPASVGEVQERLSRLRQDRQHMVYVAELASGQVVGWVHVYLCPLLIADLGAEIGGLVVDENWRSIGIGLRLLQQAEQWAQQQGCWAVHVRSNVTRERAHRFYERIGYQTIKTQRVFRRICANNRPGGDETR